MGFEMVVRLTSWKWLQAGSDIHQDRRFNLVATFFEFSGLSSAAICNCLALIEPAVNNGQARVRKTCPPNRFGSPG